MPYDLNPSPDGGQSWGDVPDAMYWFCQQCPYVYRARERLSLVFCPKCNGGTVRLDTFIAAVKSRIEREPFSLREADTGRPDPRAMPDDFDSPGLRALAEMSGDALHEALKP